MTSEERQRLAFLDYAVKKDTTIEPH
jgi:hypothetical protein